jgi:hypothetical protein
MLALPYCLPTWSLQAPLKHTCSMTHTLLACSAAAKATTRRAAVMCCLVSGHQPPWLLRCFAVAPLSAFQLECVVCQVLGFGLAGVAAAHMLIWGILLWCVVYAAILQQAFLQACLHGKYSYMQQQLLYMQQGCIVCRAMCSVQIRHCLCACRAYGSYGLLFGRMMQFCSVPSFLWLLIRVLIRHQQ